jgi:hypothetical protein
MVAAAALVGGALLTGSFGQKALSETGTITINADGNYGAYGGGEFMVTNFTNGGLTLATPGAGVAAPGSAFQTFCIQADMPLYPNVPYTWTLSRYLDDDVTTPLLSKSAYLYGKFFKAQFGASYNLTPGAARVASARSLQLALWSLQSQLSSPDLVAEFNADTQANLFVADANANAPADPADIGTVRVLVLTDGTTGNFQDVLVMLDNSRSGGPDVTVKKTATWDGYPADLKPFQPVTYSFVVTNTGGVTLTNIDVFDDNFTPNDPSDDIKVGTIASLAPGDSSTPLTLVLYPPIKLCAPNPNGGPDVDPAGQLLIEDTIENGIPVICASYIQSESVNDNRYGVDAHALVGWVNTGHSFNDLVGSDKCEFRFKNGGGATVLDFYSDYISSASSATFAGGTITYPTGYGTLGPNGGDGSLVSGSLSNVVSVHTSLSDNLKLPQFFASKFRTNSPTETAPLSDIPASPLEQGWDYRDSYTVCVKKSVFGASGFGSVSIPDQHNSPNKIGQIHGLVPEPCDSLVTNTATATFFIDGVKFSVKDTLGIVMKGTFGAGGGGGAGATTLTTLTLDKAAMTIKLKNTGTAPVTIQKLKLDWPAADLNLLSIKNGATTLFNTSTAPTTTTVTTWLSTASKRTINAGGTLTLKFTFAKNPISKLTSDYNLFLDTGSGFGADLIN